MTDLYFVRTCEACPEQYEVFSNSTRVGYVRYRHGKFTVDCPDALDENVLTIKVDETGTGIFSDEERDGYLQQAADAIMSWMIKEKQISGLTECCPVCFTVLDGSDWGVLSNGDSQQNPSSE